jgi:type II secretory ATPase GspE/PulE/Tfp pilus assembly ATPase PilB-like protein
MTDLSHLTTLSLPFPDEPATSPATLAAELSTDEPAVSARAKAQHPAWCWPTPALATYPAAQQQVQPLACEIEGLNGKTMTGRLIFFVPEQQVMHVQVPPARTTLPLRFHQFRSLALAEPLEARPGPAADPHAGMLEQRPRTPWRIQFAGEAGERCGDTIGHVETPFGLFLFEPLNDDGSRVRRLFIPREAYAHAELGPRIGDVLVTQRAATPEQVQQAAAMQAELRGKKLGDILVARRIVAPEQLLAAIEQQGKMPMVRIGEALLAMQMITQRQLDEALAEQKRDRSVPLGQLLLKLGIIRQEDLQTALARKMGYPLVDAEQFPLEPEAMKKVPFAMAVRLEALPLLVRDGTLVVAVVDPTQRLLIDEIEFVAQCKVVPVLCTHGNLAGLIRSAYGRVGYDQVDRSGKPVEPIVFEFTPADTGKLVESLEKEGRDEREREPEEDRQIEQSDNSLVKLINTMIIEAHADGVSDIHVESQPGREKIKVRFRKDGLLRPYLELPHNYRNALIARIKIMCDLDISERRKPQDGKINFAKYSPAHKIELRVATIPTNNGLEDVVMRILASARPIPLDALGLSQRNYNALRGAMERPYGMVLCVGPTGSGKTTTLHSALSHINVPERKIWTAEDPVEITQPGLRQVQVNAKIDWTFARALRAFLRADPDVIMVGEVRDAETARTAIEASLTGHLVLSTLHTNSAPETVTRLLDMGMDPFNFADSLLAVLAQRLVRRLCAQCRTERPLTEAETGELLDDYLHAAPADVPTLARDAVQQEWLQRFGTPDGRLRHYHSPGCTGCNGTGHQGRAGLHELMTISRELRRLVQTGARAEDLQRQAMREGMRTLRQDGIEKVLAGITHIEEVRSTSNV